MTATWQVQQALYTALSSDTTFMTKIGNRLFDEPRTDETYPYETIGNMLELRFNKLVGVGYEVTAIFAIYTKSGRLGFKVAKEILLFHLLMLQLEPLKKNLMSFQHQ